MSNRDFRDIESPALRTWNRCATAFNLQEDKGENAVGKYMDKFTQRERRQMMVMFDYIERKGYEATKREVMRGVHG